MKIIVKYFPARFPAVLRMSIHDAPQRRAHREVIQQYREALFQACVSAGVPVPLDEVTDVELCFINPVSPDAGGSFLAWEQAVDGKTLKGPAVFTDDALVGNIHMMRMFPNGMYDSHGRAVKKGMRK